FNAMRPLGHREPGIVAAVLTDSRLSADIIADGVHLDPTIVELFLKMKGEEGAVLITDAISATGMPTAAIAWDGSRSRARTVSARRRERSRAAYSLWIAQSVTSSSLPAGNCGRRSGWPR